MELKPGFKIRQMNLDDFKMVIRWANYEGWFFSLSDAEPFFKLDPNGFFLCELDGEPIGSLIAPKFGDYGFIDLFMILEDYRGQGYGKILLDHALNYLKDCKSIGLDAEFEMKGFWEKAGFVKHYHTLYYGKTAKGTLDKSLVDLKKGDYLDAVVEYDTRVFGYSRKDFLESLLKRKDTFALGAMKDGELAGFGIVRRHHGGLDYFIGPLNAETPEIAKQLFDSLQSFLRGKEVYTSIYDCNEAAKEMINKSEGWVKVAHENRMYKGEIPKINVNKMYSPVEEFC